MPDVCSTSPLTSAHALSFAPQLDEVNAFPGPCSIVVLDNASIHRSLEFVNAVNARGAIVIFTPPYCWDLTPLDNGAFGSVKQWLMDRSTYIDSRGWSTRQALDAAFKWAVNNPSARHCVHKCNDHGMVYV